MNELKRIIVDSEILKYLLAKDILYKYIAIFFLKFNFIYCFSLFSLY